MNDTERERIIDARVKRRLGTDRAYRDAENSEDQARAERTVELRVELEVAREEHAQNDTRGRELIERLEDELREHFEELVYGPERPWPCVHGHFDCATFDRGPCANETLARLIGEEV